LNIPNPPARRRRPSGPTALLRIVLAVSVLSIVISIVTVLISIFYVSGQVSDVQQSLSHQMTKQLQDLGSHLPSATPAVTPSSATPTATATPAATTSPTTSPSATAPPVGAPSVTWTCAHQSPAVYQCEAKGSPGTSHWTVYWWVGGQKIGTGWTQVPLGIDKTEKVQAILVSPSGKSYPGPVKTLSP
jgi:hypothetical protein